MSNDTSKIPYGYCHCGCGQKTKLATQTCKKYGWIKGQPLLYIVHHRAKMSLPLADRLWSRISIDTDDECWEWQGNVNKKTGYGQIGYRYKMFLTHRIAYILTYGEIPDKLLVCHTCDNRRCCNPKHLFLGTYHDNASDMWKKNRHRIVSNPGESSGNHKLTNEDVLYIREKYAQGNSTYVDLGREMNISPRHVSYIVTRKSWKHI